MHLRINQETCESANYDLATPEASSCTFVKSKEGTGHSVGTREDALTLLVVCKELMQNPFPTEPGVIRLTHVIPALGRPRKDCHEMESYVSAGYT